jgi:DNA-binding transcriptional LysR family regulator
MRTTRPHLPALRTFESVARLGSVGKAAEELSVTPGAVSQLVVKLERTLRVDLFVRRHRKLTLTESGRLLAARLTESFDAIERALDAVAGSAGSRRLRLRVTPTFAIRWLVPRLTGFYEQHPEFEIEVGTYPRQEDVAIEDVDFIVRHGHGGWEDAASDPIFPDALSPVCSPAVAKQLVSPEDLAAQNLLHSMMRADAWHLWLREAGLASLRPRHSINLANAAVTYQAAIDGQGVALGQLRYVRDELESGRLVQPFARVMRTGAGYWLSYSKRRSAHPNVRVFRAWVASLAAKDAAGPESWPANTQLAS